MSSLRVLVKGQLYCDYLKILEICESSLLHILASLRLVQCRHQPPHITIISTSCLHAKHDIEMSNPMGLVAR